MNNLNPTTRSQINEQIRQLESHRDANERAIREIELENHNINSMISALHEDLRCMMEDKEHEG